MRLTALLLGSALTRRPAYDGAGLAAEPDKPGDPSKIWTSEELDALVTKGELTEAQARAHLDAQTIRLAAAAGRDAALAATAGANIETAIKGALARYEAAIPELAKKDSPEFLRVAAKFAALVELGHGKKGLEGRRTELAALEATFGSVDALEAARKQGKRTAFEGGTGAGGGDRPDADDPMPKGLTDKQKAHYKFMVDNSMLTWAEVKAEIEGGRPRTKAERLALMQRPKAQRDTGASVAKH